ncbi:MAG TPA: fumarylacetoacetate hydrolase family protein [Aggregatilineaceae bacterium]|nr:fumarylacetoacetate hydrolase family protein [Aggregatilineaceae bacterium]
MPLLACFATPEGLQYGVVENGMIHAWEGDNIFTAKSLTPGPGMMPVDQIQLMPPAWPSKIVCVGRNYAAHAAEHQADVPEEPMLFLKPPSALIGPNVPIRFAGKIGRVDHEAELAVIIKQPAYKITPEEAPHYIFGYTCANDVSARGYQKKDGQWGRAKGFDTFCPLGPFINTDLDPSNLLIRAYVNDEVRQEDHTSNMVFNVPTLVSFISQVMTLQAGDVILTGTPAGVSELHDGDVVRIEIEGIGTLSNPVQVEA